MTIYVFYPVPPSRHLAQQQQVEKIPRTKKTKKTAKAPAKSQPKLKIAVAAVGDTGDSTIDINDPVISIDLASDASLGVAGSTGDASGQDANDSLSCCDESFELLLSTLLDDANDETLASMLNEVSSTPIIE